MKITAAIILSFFIIFSGCAQTPRTADTNSGATQPIKEAADKEAKETECKICGFDFAAYKGELAKEEINGLLLALNDEYMATAIYQRVNSKFDDPRPFVNIVEAEKRHAERLKGLFEKYSIAVPDNPWPGNVPEFDSVKLACEAGVKAEEENMDLYTRLFASTKREDILVVYRALQNASEQNHLPAFKRCVSGGGGRGMGRGARNN